MVRFPRFSNKTGNKSARSAGHARENWKSRHQKTGNQSNRVLIPNVFHLRCKNKENHHPGPPKKTQTAKMRRIAITTVTKLWKSLCDLKAPKMNPKVRRWPWPDFLDFQVKAKIRNSLNEMKWQPAVAGIILAVCCSTRPTAASCSRRATTDRR